MIVDNDRAVVQWSGVQWQTQRSEFDPIGAVFVSSHTGGVSTI